jgi:hypothetical protein
LPTNPLTGARYPTSGNATNVPQDIQNAVTDLSVQVLPRYATTAARDSAFSAWTSAGNSLAEGMYAYTQAEDTLWYYNGTVWTWPRWARGELMRSDYTNTSSGVVLANTDTGLPAFDTTVPFIPSGRRIEISFNAIIASDSAGTYIFTLWQGAVSSGTIRRQLAEGTVGSAVAQTVSGSRVFQSTVDLTNQLFSVSGKRSAGSGTFSLFGDTNAGVAQLSVRDLGAV